MWRCCCCRSKSLLIFRFLFMFSVCVCVRLPASSDSPWNQSLLILKCLSNDHVVSAVSCWSVRVEEDQAFVRLTRGGQKFVVHLLNFTDSSRLWKLRYQIALEHNPKNSFCSHQHRVTMMMSLLQRTKLNRDYDGFISAICVYLRKTAAETLRSPSAVTRWSIFLVTNVLIVSGFGQTHLLHVNVHKGYIVTFMHVITSCIDITLNVCKSHPLLFHWHLTLSNIFFDLCAVTKLRLRDAEPSEHVSPPVYSTSTSASAFSVFSKVTLSRSRAPTRSYTILVLVMSSSESCWICSGVRSQRSRFSEQTGTGLPKTTSPGTMRDNRTGEERTGQTGSNGKDRSGKQEHFYFVTSFIIISRLRHLTETKVSSNVLRQLWILFRLVCYTGRCVVPHKVSPTPD